MSFTECFLSSLISKQSYGLCACYLLFGLKRLSRRLGFINDQIIEDEAINNS